MNPTDENFEDVVVEVTLPLPRAFVHRSLPDARDTLEPPEEPAPWGSSMATRLAPRVPSSLTKTHKLSIRRLDKVP